MNKMGSLPQFPRLTHWFLQLWRKGWTLSQRHSVQRLSSSKCLKSTNQTIRKLYFLFVDILNSAFHTSSSFEDVDVRSKYSLQASQRLYWTHDGLCYPGKKGCSKSDFLSIIKPAGKMPVVNNASDSQHSWLTIHTKENCLTSCVVQPPCSNWILESRHA